MPVPSRKSLAPVLASAGIVLILGWWTFPRSDRKPLSPAGPESRVKAELPQAQTFLSQGEWDRALTILEEIAGRESPDLAALEELRWLNFNLLRSREALRILHRKLAAGDLVALPDILDTQQRQPVPQESVRTLEEVDRKRPDQPALQAALGRCRWHLGELAEARRLLAWALEQRPGDAHIRLTMAEFLLEQGEIEEAEKLILTDGAQGGPGLPAALAEDSQTWLLRAQIEDRRGHAEAALALLDRAITLEPARIDLLTRRGTLLRLLKREEEAREGAQQVDKRAAAGRELAALVDAGKHRNPAHADALRFASLCEALGRSDESQGWTAIAGRLAELNRNGL